MTRTFTLGGLLALVLIPPSISAPKARGLALPREFSKYREWTQLLNVPYQVPLELWIRCVAPTLEDRKAAREKYGPHTERFIRVYGNAEKLSRAPHGNAAGVAFMVKRGTSQFPDSDGWEFMYFPSTGDPRTTQQACASCHHVARSRDYVFGEYPR